MTNLHIEIWPSTKQPDKFFIRWPDDGYIKDGYYTVEEVIMKLYLLPFPTFRYGGIYTRRLDYIVNLLEAHVEQSHAS